MKTMNRLFAALLLAPLAGMLIAAKALAAEEGYRLDRAPIDPRDLVSLQSGARTFANYCLSCHSAALVPLPASHADRKDNRMCTSCHDLSITQPPAMPHTQDVVQKHV